MPMKLTPATCPVRRRVLTAANCGQEPEYTLESVLVHYSIRRADDGSYDHDGERTETFDESAEPVTPDEESGGWSRDRDQEKSTRMIVGHHDARGDLHEWPVEIEFVKS